MPRSYRFTVTVQIDPRPVARPTTPEDVATDRRMRVAMVTLSRQLQRRLTGQFSATLREAMRQGWRP